MARKKINKMNISDWTNFKCYYIGKIGDSSIIVYYEGKIIEDLGDNVKCEMLDRNINRSNDFFEITLSKKLVGLNR